MTRQNAVCDYTPTYDYHSGDIIRPQTQMGEQHDCLFRPQTQMGEQHDCHPTFCLLIAACIITSVIWQCIRLGRHMNPMN